MDSSSRPIPKVPAAVALGQKVAPFDCEDATEASPHTHHLKHHSSSGHLSSHNILDDVIPEDDTEVVPKEGGAADETSKDADDTEQDPALLPIGVPAGPESKFSPVPWGTFFESEREVSIPETQDIFHVYTAGKEGPVLLCLHGAGYTGVSFALAAEKMKDMVQIVAPDLRGHGLTKTDNDSDLSAETLCADVVNLVDAMFGTNPPAIVLAGHSMGGAVAVRLAALHALPTLAGLVVVDVVEGTAIASLVHMEAILAGRPHSFRSLEKAIEWSVRGGALRNVESARISVPSTLKPDGSPPRRYVWRTKLEESEPHWRGWYEGLSEAFVAATAPKLLLLAGTDRLDKPLTIAQMQGKFQMVVIRHSGHAIQEDEPDEFASCVLGFIGRNRIGPRGVEIPRPSGIHRR